MTKLLGTGAAVALLFGACMLSGPASAAPVNATAIGATASQQAIVQDVAMRRCEKECRHREMSRRVCVKRCVTRGDRY